MRKRKNYGQVSGSKQKHQRSLDTKNCITEKLNTKAFIEDQKQKLLLLINEKGECKGIDCDVCPIFSLEGGCAYSMFYSDMHYDRAIRKFIELYGEDALVEYLL